MSRFAARSESTPPGGSARPAPLAPITWSTLRLIVAVDAAWAVSDFVLRPLLVAPPDLPAALRGGLVFAALTLGAAAARWQLPNRKTGVVLGASRGAPPASSHTLAVCLAELGAVGRNGPATLAVHTASPVVEIFWAGPPPEPSPPWRANDTGWVWEADHDQLTGPARPAPPWLAAIVELGVTPTGSLWLNLGAFRIVALVGDHDDVEHHAEALVAALQRRAQAGLLELAVLGDPVATPAPAPSQPELEELLALVWRRVGRRGEQTTPRQGRRVGRVAPSPLVVVAAAARTTLERLVPAARCDPDMTLLVVGDAAAADLRLTWQEGRVRVPFLGAVSVVARAHRDAPGADLRAASPEPAAASDAAPTPLDAPPASADGPPSVEVGVLGAVDAHGSAEPLAGKSLELVAYLACHPDGVRDERIRAALWPGRALSASTWAHRVWAARKALGADVDGTPRLRRFRGHVGRLTPSVRTDLAALSAATTRLGDATAPDAAGEVAAALERVRGRPFDMPRGYHWAHTELHVAHAERIVVDAAHRVAGLALDAGDWQRALRASECGLLACPESEVLDQDRTRARRAAGDRHGLAAVRELLESIGAVPAGTLDADTVEGGEPLGDVASPGGAGAPWPTE